MRILFFLIAIVGIVFCLQLLKVGQLITQLKGNKEEDIVPESNNKQAYFLGLFGIIFLSIVVWMTFKYGWAFTRDAASEHGLLIDQLLLFNWIILGIVFFLVQGLLFFFAKKYVYQAGRKAYYYSHNNTLEVVWTSIPALTMSIIIIWGLWVWNDVMGADTAADATNVELYAKQFDWTARYPGKDGKFGLTSYNVIFSENPLGIVTEETVSIKLSEIEEDLAKLRQELINKTDELSDRKKGLQHEKIRNLVLHRNRILQINLKDPRVKDGEDDILVKSEFHLPVDKQVSFQFRSRDVIHSAYMLDFRAQMNTVPGVPTIFKFTPIITSVQMRQRMNQPDFNYKLTCNKICGASHWNMTMDIVVEDQQNYEKWLASQKTFKK
jgi:cytochrome c oxidase subunit 2